MNIAIYTIGLFRGREHLMPWRTIFEVAKHLCREQHTVSIINVSNHQKDYCWHNTIVKCIDYGYVSLANEVCALNIDALFVQVTWRDALKDMSPLKRLSCRKIAYFTGGVYKLSSTMMLAKSWGVMAAKPYLIESVVPKSILVKKLKAVGFEKAIGLTPYTAECSRKAGFKHSMLVLTGKDAFDEIMPDASVMEKYKLKGKKFMLFSGAPAPTRGACELLKAIDKTLEDVKVIMLMRTDVGSEYDNFNHIYEGMKHKEKVVLIREKVTREQLRAFFGEAYYDLLPFLVIPSEIPVTYLEVMACGTPVITFENGGTTRYLKEGLVVSGKSISALAKTLDEAWKDEDTRQAKAKKALAIMSQHPTWKQVADEWLKTIE